jgi:hypothetical protein
VQDTPEVLGRKPSAKDMSQINPILGSIVQTPMAQRQQELVKAEQARHRQDQRKNTAASSEEEVEESVESPDEVPPTAGDSHPRQHGKGTYSRKKEEEESETPADGDGLDLTA